MSERIESWMKEARQERESSRLDWNREMARAIRLGMVYLGRCACGDSVTSLEHVATNLCDACADRHDARVR